MTQFKTSPGSTDKHTGKTVGHYLLESRDDGRWIPVFFGKTKKECREEAKLIQRGQEPDFVDPELVKDMQEIVDE